MKTLTVDTVATTDLNTLATWFMVAVVATAAVHVIKALS